MPTLEELAEQTCRRFLTAAHLKSICRLRGFEAPGLEKDHLASFVAARLPDTSGVREAMASLDEVGLLLLHRLAMSPGSLSYTELRRVIRAQAGHPIDDRAIFSKVLDSLGSRGCLLLNDAGGRRSNWESRYVQIDFSIPGPHRPFIPPFPIESSPLERPGRAADPFAVCRKAIAAAAALAGRKPSSKPKDTLERLSRRVSFTDGRSSMMGRSTGTAAEILSWVQDAWFSGSWGESPGRRRVHDVGPCLSAVWSDLVSRVALGLGVVHYDTKGSYRTDSSQDRSFCDNEIEVVEKAWRAYLERSPLERERALLDALLRNPENEFFVTPTLIELEPFDRHGCATGPASRMDLPKVRRGLMDLLAGLEANVWYEMRDFVEHVRAVAPHLILDPATRGPDGPSSQRLHDWNYRMRYGGKTKQPPPKPEIVLEDIYVNFREFDPKDRWSSKGPTQLVSSMKDAFQRVEGRYLERFLSEAPYLAGWVDLAFRADDDRHGLASTPPLERLRAFRLRPRLFQVFQRDEALNRIAVTVLPNFEVVVEAPSYPGRQLLLLEPFTILLKEDGPVIRLRLDRKRTVAHAAANPDARTAAQVLGEVARGPLPGNVNSELEAWSGHADKLTFYEGLGLLELPGDEEQRCLAGEDVREWIADDRLTGLLLVRNPGKVFARLEERERVPVELTHPATGFRGTAGILGKTPEGLGPAKPTGAAARARRAEPARKEAPAKVRLQTQDLVGYRCQDKRFLAALHEAIRGEVPDCWLLDANTLAVAAADLPKVRAALKRLADRFEVET